MTWWAQLCSDVYNGATLEDLVLAGVAVILSILYVFTRGEFRLREEDPHE